MKHFYLLSFAVLAFTASFSQSSLQLNVPYGIWSVDLSWNQGRTPVDGDVIVIPANSTVVVSKKITLNNTHIRVYGTVSLIGNNASVELDNQSDIVIYDGGKIEKTDPSAKVKLDGINIFSGAANSITGPSTATASTAGFQSFILPVRFVGFGVAQGSNGSLIQWSTSEEHNAGSFEVERSLDGANWSTIATVKAAGNSSSLTNYSFTDKAGFEKLVYYRVKQVDVDGKYVYTAIKSIKADSTNKTEVKVAAAQNKVILQFSHPVKSGVSVRLISLNGVVINEQRVGQAVGQVILNTNNKGNYIVSVSNGQDLNVARQVVL